MKKVYKVFPTYAQYASAQLSLNYWLHINQAILYKIFK